MSGRLYKSVDSGRTWEDVTGTLPRGILDIAVDPTNRDIAYVTTNISGVYITTDAGKSWSPWNDNLVNPVPATNGNNVTRCLALSANGSTLYFGSFKSGVFRRRISK